MSETKKATDSITEEQGKLIRAKIAAAIDKAKKRDELTGPDSQSIFASEPERNLALLAGRYWHLLNRLDMLSVNYIGPAWEIMNGLTVGGVTEFEMRPRRQEFADIIQTSKGLLNDHWQALGFDIEADNAHHDVGANRYGVVEVGWRYKDEKREMTGGRPASWDLAAENLPKDAMPVMVNGQMVAPRPAEGMVNLPGQEIEESEARSQESEEAQDIEGWGEKRPEYDDGYVERISPTDFFYDPNCTRVDLSDAKFAFRRKRVPLNELKGNKNFSNTKELKPDEFEHYADPSTGSGQAKLPLELEEKFGLVTIFDGGWYVDGELLHLVFANQEDKPLLVEPFPYEFGPCAKSLFNFIVIPAKITNHDNEWAATPVVSTVRDIQVSHDEAYTQIEWTRAHTPNVLLTPTGTFQGDEGEETKRRIEEGKENAVLEIEQNFIQYVKWMDRPLINSQAYEDLHTTEERIQRQVGISPFQANQAPEKKMTAMEAGTLSSQGGARQITEAEKYDAFLSEIGYKLLCLYQQFAERPRPYSFRTEDGQQQWGMAGMKELRGLVPGSDTNENPMGELYDVGIQFALDISPSKRQAQNKYLERKERVELLGMLKDFNMPDPRLPNRPLVNLPVVLRGVIETMDLPGKDKIIPPEPTPEEIQAFQAQQAAQAQEQQEMALRQGQDGQAQKGQETALKQAQEKQDQANKDREFMLKVAQAGRKQ